MADTIKTYDELLTDAEKIRTNELPNSNSANIVGGHLKDFLNKTKTDNDTHTVNEKNINANTGTSEYPEFDLKKKYAIGDVVLHNGLLRRFTAMHSSGPWNDVDNVTYSINKKINSLVESGVDDFSISDENGNIIQRNYQGHIKTKNFDSKNIEGLTNEIIDSKFSARDEIISQEIKERKEKDISQDSKIEKKPSVQEGNSVLSIEDENNNVVFINDNQIKTKCFDSSKAIQTIGYYKKNVIAISDDQDNIMCEISSDGLKSSESGSKSKSNPSNRAITDNVIINLILEELYIPQWKSDWYISDFVLNTNALNIIIRDGEKDIKCNLDIGGSPSSFNLIYGTVITLYEYNAQNILGYCVCNNISCTLNDIKCYMNSNVNKLYLSTIIKKYLRSPRQLILIGDSTFKGPREYILQNILQQLIPYTRIINAGFGGGTMAYRTTDGSDVWDAATAPKLIDSIIQKNYDDILKLNTSRNGLFNTNIAELKQIDLNIESYVVCDFVENDFGRSISLGNKWEYTDNISSFKKFTVLGAMNYFIHTIYNNYTNVNMYFMSNPIQTYDNIPDYFYGNELNMTVRDYCKEIEANCERYGIKYGDIIKSGIYNIFNNKKYKTDEHHFNADGYYLYAEFISKLIKNK